MAADDNVGEMMIQCLYIGCNRDTGTAVANFGKMTL